VLEDAAFFELEIQERVGDAAGFPVIEPTHFWIDSNRVNSEVRRKEGADA
jgi:hypothetical protein